VETILSTIMLGVPPLFLKEGVRGSFGVPFIELFEVEKINFCSTADFMQ
jgi:hypothetical protein